MIRFKYQLLFLLVALVLIVSPPVSASGWVVDGDKWVDNTTFAGTTLVMWNTTGFYPWFPHPGISSVMVLTVGGGASGANAAATGQDGGGGAGGVAFHPSYPIPSGTTMIPVIVGDGGAAIAVVSNGYKGYNSSFNFFVNGTGGGYGGHLGVGGDGGGAGGGKWSSAGGVTNQTSPLGGVGYGNNGGAGGASSGGAGGGAGAVGGAGAADVGGAGGVGVYQATVGATTYDFETYFGEYVGHHTGGHVYFAGGGSGAGFTQAQPAGGLGGGGGGAAWGSDGVAGLPGTGGGGSANNGNAGAGYKQGAGGNGVVIIRYTTPVPTSSFVSYNVSISTNATTSVGWQGPPPFTVMFNDTSSNFVPTSWVWNYTKVGDTSPVTFNQSTFNNTRYTFDTDGNYSISLNATNSVYSKMSAQSTWVNVTTPRSVTADYMVVNQAGMPPLTTTVIDASTNTNALIDEYNWTFGDGTQSFLQNPPAHVYSTAGLYELNLTVTNTTFSKSSYKMVTVAVINDLNPSSTYTFKPDNNIIRNITIYNRTIQLVNVNNASFANGTMYFDPNHVIVNRVLANSSTVGTITMAQSSINNTTGVVIFNVTNTSGFNAGSTPISIVDVEMLYDTYSAGDMTGAWGNGYLGNITYDVVIPVTNLIDTPLNYSWTTFSNFTVSDSTPLVFEDPVTFTPVDNTFAADRYLYDFDDGETFLSHNRTGVWHIYSLPGTYSPDVTAYLSANTSVTNYTRLMGSVVASYNTTYVHADFSGTPTSGSVGLNVQFTDLTIWGNASADKIYNWSFGDGTYSASPYSDLVGNPSHVYPALGTYTVRLQVNNTRNASLGSDVEEKVNYIVISSSQSTTWYTQHLVQIKAVDRYGVPLSYSNVSVRFLASGLPDTSISWIQSAFGVSESVASEMADNSYLMEVAGGSDGAATFMMFPGFSYGITITNVTSGVNHYTTILPADSAYVIYCPTSEQQVTTNQTLTQLVNTSIYITEPNNSYVTFNILYQDTSGLTTNLRWNVTQWDNRTPMYYKDFGNPGTASVYDNYTAANVRGQEWKFWYNATRSAKS